ncbi:uncharacterized protein [Primulina eburnea]|uniref:uncharacterized protein n=1 Tax=Primulina eburnea TaxID=1245227 RepID=UPI003C6C3603
MCVCVCSHSNFEYRSLTTIQHSFKVQTHGKIQENPDRRASSSGRRSPFAAEAGLFSFFLVPEENKKHAAASVVSQNPVNISGVFPYRKEKMDGTDRPRQSFMATQVVQNRSPDKVFGAFHEVHKDPSIFFIGGGESTETESKYVADDRGEEDGEVISGQELFQKAEIFIGNFYQQLNIQREESWKKLHDFTHS